MVQALLAGAVVLGTGPIALALVLFFASTPEDPGPAGLARLINEGGGFSFGVLALGALATIGAAILTAVSIRRPTVPGSLALVFFVLPMAIAVFGLRFGMKNMLDAVAMVNPLDKPIILVVGSGEVTALTLQALCFVAGGALSIAVASFLGLMAPGRGARLVTALGSLVLGAGFVASAMGVHELHHGFTAIGSMEAADRLTIYFASVMAWEQFGTLANGAMLAALVIAGVGATALTAKGEKGLAIGTAAGLIVSLVGVRGLDSLAHRRLFAALEDFAIEPPALVALPGIAKRITSPISLSDADALDEAIKNKLSYSDEKVVGFDLFRDVKREDLVRGLAAAHAQQADVDLFVLPPPRNFDALPKDYRLMATMLASLPRAVPVKVLFEGEACDDCKGPAKLVGDSLQVGDEKWAGKELDVVFGVERFDRVELDWENGTPEALAKAASIALGNDHVVVVRVPAPEGR